MGRVEDFQMPLEAAEAYEELFVPRLFGDWARLVVDAAHVGREDRVLDVATGTGIAARVASDRARSVVGLDLNEAMLQIAARLAPDIEWRQGDAASLPFEDASFDVVQCQAGLMFFPEPARALSEMRRVTAAGGRVVIQVWDTLDHQPPYVALADVAARHAGPDATSLLGAYFELGDVEALTHLVLSAGLQAPEISTHETVMSFGSLEEFISSEVSATPLAERITDDVQRQIVDDAREALSRYMDASGETRIPIRGHIVVSQVASA